MRLVMPRYSEKNDRVLCEVNKLMVAKNISHDLPEYGLNEFGHIIQEWIDDEYGVGQLRLECYDSQNFDRPIWVSGGNVATAKPLYIYYLAREKCFYFNRRKALSMAKKLPYTNL